MKLLKTKREALEVHPHKPQINKKSKKIRRDTRDLFAWEKCKQEKR